VAEEVGKVREVGVWCREAGKRLQTVSWVKSALDSLLGADWGRSYRVIADSSLGFFIGRLELALIVVLANELSDADRRRLIKLFEYAKEDPANSPEIVFISGSEDPTTVLNLVRAGLHLDKIDVV